MEFLLLKSALGGEEEVVVGREGEREVKRTHSLTAEMVSLLLYLLKVWQ